MIDLKFFNKMKSVLAFDSFNPANYTANELQVLFSNQRILNSAYCNPIFREQALEFFKVHRADLKINSTNILIKEFATAKPSETVDGKFTLLPDAESMKAEIERLKKAIDNELGYIRIVGDGWEVLTNPEDYSDAKINQYFEKSLEIRTQILEIADYYHAWRPSEETIQSQWHSMIDNLYKLTGSLQLTQFSLSALKPAETLNLLTENIFNSGWGGEEKFEKFNNVNSEYKELYRELIKFKGWNGLNLALSLVDLPEEQNKFFTKILPRIKSAADNFILTPETANLIEKEILALTSLNKDRSLPLPENCEKLNLPKLLELAAKYKMSKAIIFKLINEEFPKFNLTEDNVGRLLTSKAGAGAEIVDPTSTFQFDLNIKIGGKKLKVELLAKNDPTALFVGKMTNCCQFYTGHSSVAAVIPVYTDPNAGLVVIRTNSGQVKAASFAWLCKNEAGGVEGLVLDSFEYHYEAGRIFLPFINQLAAHLSEKGLKFFVGSGGKTPELHIKEEDKFVKLETIPHPLPLTEGFKPYGDSSTVYQIEAGKDYTIECNKNFEVGDIKSFINKSLERLSFDEVDMLNKKFYDTLIKEIAAHSLTKGSDFVKTLKIASLFNFPTLGYDFLDSIILLSDEQVLAFSSTEGLQSLVNRFAATEILATLLNKTRAEDYSKLKLYLECWLRGLKSDGWYNLTTESIKFIPILLQNTDEKFWLTSISKLHLTCYSNNSEGNYDDFEMTPEDGIKLGLFLADFKEGREVYTFTIPAFIKFLREFEGEEIHKLFEFFSSTHGCYDQTNITIFELALKDAKGNVDQAIAASKISSNFADRFSVGDCAKYNLHKIGQMVDIAISLNGFVDYKNIIYLINSHVDLATVTEANFLELSTPKPAIAVNFKAVENVGHADDHSADSTSTINNEGGVEAIGEVNIVTANLG